MPRMPDVALTAVPGRRRWTIDLAQEIERRGFGGVYSPSFGDALALCEAVALATKTLRMGTSIANIYTRHPFEYAQTASFLHEVSDGRFTFGVGVSHGPTHERLGTSVGKPLTEMRRFVEQVRAAEPQVGPLPPIVLATLRDRMVRLASEIGQGAVWPTAHVPSWRTRSPCSRRSSARVGSTSATWSPPASTTTARRRRTLCAEP